MGLEPMVGAVSFTGRGSITIKNFLVIDENRPLDFGLISMPSSGESIFELSSTDGSVLLSGGNGDGAYLGGSSAGKYRVSGEPNQSIQASVDIKDFDVPGIRMLSSSINGAESGVLTDTLSDEGVLLLQVGGRVGVSADAELGNHTTDVYVTAVYQ